MNPQGPIHTAPNWSRGFLCDDASPNSQAASRAGFTGDMEERTQRELQALWDTLWRHTHSEEALRAALAGPRIGWNPYRPARGGHNVRAAILNAEVAELQSVIPTDCLYVAGSPMTLCKDTHTFSLPRQVPGHSGSLEHLGEPQDLLSVNDLSVMRNDGCKASVCTSPRGDTRHSPVETVLAQHGTIHRDVQEAHDTRSTNRGSPTAIIASQQHIDPLYEEIVEDVSTVLFDKLWAAVVVPYYTNRQAAKVVSTAGEPHPTSAQQPDVISRSRSASAKPTASGDQVHRANGSESSCRPSLSPATVLLPTKLRKQRQHCSGQLVAPVRDEPLVEEVGGVIFNSTGSSPRVVQRAHAGRLPSTTVASKEGHQPSRGPRTSSPLAVPVPPRPEIRSSVSLQRLTTLDLRDPPVACQVQLSGSVAKVLCNPANRTTTSRRCKKAHRLDALVDCPPKWESLMRPPLPLRSSPVPKGTAQVSWTGLPRKSLRGFVTPPRTRFQNVAHCQQGSQLTPGLRPNAEREPMRVFSGCYKPHEGELHKRGPRFSGRGPGLRSPKGKPRPTTTHH